MNRSLHARVAPPPDRPMPVLWSGRGRDGAESALDAETAVELNCLVGHLFERAKGWNTLLDGLARHGFALQFEGTRLVLVNDQTGQDLCTCASFGHSFASLLERLGKPAVLADSGRLVPRPER